MAKITRIAPELPAANLPAALEYYEQKLGFRVAMQMPANDYAIVERDGVAIHLFQDVSAKNGDAGHSPVGVHVFTPDLDEMYTEFQRSGAHLTQGIERKPWGNLDFRLHDPSGNELKFTEPLEDH